MFQINNAMGYLPPQKNFSNTEVFTKKITFEIEMLSLANQSRENFIIIKGLIRISN